MKSVYIILLTILCISLKSYSQVNIQDSLALVDFYYSVNGPASPTMNNWLVTLVKHWQGVTLLTPDSTRVTSIILHNRPELNGTLPLSIGDLTEIKMIDIAHTNLAGTIPYTIGRLKKLKNLYLYDNNHSGQIPDSIGGCVKLFDLMLLNNNFTGYIPQSLATLPDFSGFQIQNNQFDQLPDFSQLPNANNLMIRVENNLFTFEDLESNMVNYLWFTYSPQSDSINQTIDTIIILDSNYSISCTIGGTNNIYQWSKNGTDILSATDSILSFPYIAYADSGIYTCHVTNSVVPNLTFYRRPVTVHVTKITDTEGFIMKNNECKIWPNPVKNILNVENNNESSEILIFDCQSLLCKTFFLNNKTQQVDISDLSHGLYFLKLVSEKSTIIRKIIKE